MTQRWQQILGERLFPVLLFLRNKRIGIEIKRADAPTIMPSMQSALAGLKLDRLLMVYPGAARYPLSKQIEVLPLVDAIASLSELR